MIARTAAEIAAATGGAVVQGSPAARAAGASIDTRTLAAGEAFFAIAGERHDGHAFVEAACARGASVVVVHRDAGVPADLKQTALVRVADTTVALGALAADERARRGLLVVGITGSAGKTTTRALTAAVLAARYRTAASAGNLNNQWGLPLSLLRLPDDAEAAVLEMGMNHAGEIAALAALARPDVGVITNVGTAHIGLLGSREAIAAAKAEILDGVRDGGTGVVHAGSPELAPHLARCTRRLVRFGFEDDADVVPRHVAGDLVHGARFEVDGIPVQLALWGRHAVLNAAAALGVARALDIPLADAAERLRAVEPPAGRGRILRLARGVVLIDEVYNANPSALEAVLGELAAVAWTGRKVAVLGEMRELGEFAPRFHRELGTRAAAAGIAELHAVGELAPDIARGAIAAGLLHVHVYADAAAAAPLVAAAVRGGDLVLVKGSRGVQLEIVRDAVIAARAEGVA